MTSKFDLKPFDLVNSDSLTLSLLFVQVVVETYFDSLLSSSTENVFDRNSSWKMVSQRRIQAIAANDDKNYLEFFEISKELFVNTIVSQAIVQNKDLYKSQVPDVFSPIQIYFLN